MEEKKWIAIKGFEGFYEINSDGEVRSLDRTVLHNNRFRKVVSKQIEIRIDRAGYLTIRLNKESKTYTKSIHRLIADAFIANPNALPIINHKDGNKLNNSIENLEWVTHSENIIHAYKSGLLKGIDRAVKIIDSCSGKQFDSIKEAAKALCMNYNSCRNMLSGSIKNTSCLEYLI